MTYRKAVAAMAVAMGWGAVIGLALFVAWAAAQHTLRSHDANQTEWRKG